MKKRVQKLERLLPISTLICQRVPVEQWNDRELYHHLKGSNHPCQLGEPTPEEINQALESFYGLPPGELRRRDEAEQREIVRTLQKMMIRQTRRS